MDLAIDVTNVAIHFLAQGLDEMVHLRIRPLHHHLDAPIRQVAHVPRHVELQSQVLRCVSEPHPLNPPAEVTRAAMNRRLCLRLMLRYVHASQLITNLSTEATGISCGDRRAARCNCPIYG